MTVWQLFPGSSPQGMVKIQETLPDGALSDRPDLRKHSDFQHC